MQEINNPAIQLSEKSNSLIRMKKLFSKYEGYAYIGVWIAGFLFLQLYPLAVSLYYSFTDFNLVNIPRFVGFENFMYAFTKDPVFFKSLKVTFLYVLIAVPLKLAFALFIACVLNVKFKFINVYRTIYYIPSLLGGSIAVAIIWKFLFFYDGIINKFIVKMGLPPVPWLTNGKVGLLTLGALTVWQFGSSMVIFLAALKQIPSSLYEAATMDGASRGRIFFSITLPMITPVILFNLIMQLIAAFQEFTSAYIITNGGPLHETYLFGLMIYENAFKYFRMGYASALSWILFIIIITVTLVIFKTSNKWVYYDDGGKF